MYQGQPSGRVCRSGGGLNSAGCGESREVFPIRGKSFGGLACWAWVLPWVLLVLGGVAGVKGVAIPDCPATGWNDRTCGIRQAVDTYTTQATIDKYGPIEDWDTSLVTDMSYVFYNKSSFNANISAWQVGNVTTMEGSMYTLPPLLQYWVFFFLCLLILYLNNALSSFFHFYHWTSLCCCGVQCFILLVPSMVISPHGRSEKW